MKMPINRHGNDAEEVCQRAENKGAKEKKAGSEREKERKCDCNNISHNVFVFDDSWFFSGIEEFST